MLTVHDRATYDALRARLQSLKPDTRPRWGKMSVDQMLWHVNEGLVVALGRAPSPAMKSPLPKPVMRFLVLALPWPRGAPTAPQWVARGRHDFEAERARCLSLLDEMRALPLDGSWPVHPSFGAMRGHHWSALHAKHLNHHLTQFGA
jgi:hypothetical protein